MEGSLPVYQIASAVKPGDSKFTPEEHQALVDFCLQHVADELRRVEDRLWVKRSHIQNLLGQPEWQSVMPSGKKRPKVVMEYLTAGKFDWNPDQDDAAASGTEPAAVLLTCQSHGRTHYLSHSQTYKERVARGVVDAGFAKASSPPAAGHAQMGLDKGEDDVESGMGELVPDAEEGGGVQPEMLLTAAPVVQVEELTSEPEPGPGEEKQAGAQKRTLEEALGAADTAAQTSEPLAKKHMAGVAAQEQPAGMDESADAAVGPQEGPVGPGDRDLGQAPTPFQKLQERLRNAQKATNMERTRAEEEETMRLAVEEELRKMRLRLHTATEQQAAANRHLERARKEVQDLRAQLKAACESAPGEQSVRAQVKQLYDGMVSEYKSMLERQLSAVFLASAAAPHQHHQTAEQHQQQES